MSRLREMARQMSLHEVTCSDAKKLAHEIHTDVMAGEEEIAESIQFGFDYRERRLKDKIRELEETVARVQGSDVAMMGLLAKATDERDVARKALITVEMWAKQRCPCDNDEPKICPLCRANRDNPQDGCLSAERTMPAHVLKEVREVLAAIKYESRKD